MAPTVAREINNSHFFVCKCCPHTALLIQHKGQSVAWMMLWFEVKVVCALKQVTTITLMEPRVSERSLKKTHIWQHEVVIIYERSF